jgi:hypothetical protein
MPLHAYSVCVVLTPKHKDAWRIKFAEEVLMKSELGGGKLQVQQCPQCPVGDGRPQEGGLS